MKNTPPSAETHPNAFAWYCLVKRFNDAVRNSWGAAAGAAAGKPAPAKKAAEKPKEEKPKADDDMDLFGDDDEDDAVSLLFNSEKDI